MLMKRAARRPIHRAGHELNLVPLVSIENAGSVNLHIHQTFSAEDLAKVHMLMSLCDEDTCAHSWRIAQLAKEVACYLHLSEAEICTAFMSALLHDIGKATIPWALLNKQGPLNGREWAIIRKHPEAGAHMLRAQGGVLASLAPIVSAHHERWDGEGYPNRLQGEQIPLIGRLLTVVDSFDAMTSQRAYQRAMTDVEACMELQRCAGSQYDPLFVDAFLCMLSMQNPLIPSWSFPAIQLSALNKPAIA